MTPYPTQLSDFVAPPADERSPNMSTTTADEVHVIDVPLLALTEDDVIRRHPESDEDVVWSPVTWEVGENPSLRYTTQGSDEHQVHEFDEAMPWVTVQAPAAGVSR